MMTPAQAAHRLYVIADMIVGGRPQREMFLLAAAGAFAGIDACAARDEARQPYRVERLAEGHRRRSPSLRFRLIIPP